MSLLLLDRLRNDCGQVDLKSIKLDTSSKRIDKIAQFSKTGSVEELYNYLMLRSFKITVQEVPPVALFIKDTLQNYLDRFAKRPN